MTSEVEGQDPSQPAQESMAKAELQNSKTKAYYKFLLKKLEQLHGFIRYLICLTMSSIYLFFVSHDLIALLNALFQKFHRC